MPTGYTGHLIKEKEISFEEFALKCARAFGACITMRDDPMNQEIPDEFKESSYYSEHWEQIQNDLNTLLSENDEVLIIQYEKEYEEEIQQREESLKRANFQKQRYESMLEKVKQWEPPTKEHIWLKDFMIQQITDSISFDCHIDYYNEHSIIKLNFKQWKYNKINELKSDLKYYMEQWQKETERVAGRNKWIKDLRESLKKK